MDLRDALTPQEQQIARLAAQGLSNRQIGERLFLSPRTVGTHRYRIYPKVNVRSRAELARVLPDATGPDYVDDWDAQMMFFLANGYRVVAHDRRGHGRSAQVSSGHDMDHYADDLAALTEHLDLREAVHVGHSAGGGEVARYVSRHGETRVAKVVLISAVTPYVMAAEGRPDGLPTSVFDDFRSQLAGHRADFFRAVAAGPFYGFNRPGAEPSEAVIQSWWRQAMTGAAIAQHDEITAFCEDFTEDLRKISVPVLVMHGEDDQVVNPATTAPRAVELVADGRLKTYPGFPHGMPTTHADVINADLLDFIRS
ncbi:alpha/beta fold hydrolase [Actinoplanes sp. CA-142083]|uniref:alpha/beta fold hydrolase n=1 Tax=Actinoplanes sp. CA-142083 TaxID=3239903 RepID=UPI003D8C346A